MSLVRNSTIISSLSKKTITILLADDDVDDCLLFVEALGEIDLPTKLITVQNGEQLLQLLKSIKGDLPHVLFLDLNMPRKNGWQCLSEIKQNQELEKLKVIIFSTSFQQDVADQLFKNGATHYIRKPSDFTLLKDVIHKALLIIQESSAGLQQAVQPESKINYVLSR